MAGFWHSLRASRWVLLFAGCLSLLLAAPPASGQSENTAPPNSIEASLIDSLTASAKLRQALAEQRSKRADLETAYAALKAQLRTSSAELESEINGLQTQLADSMQRSADLEAEIQRLMALLTASKQESELLSTAFASYQAEMRAQVAGLERENRTLKALAVVLAAVAAGLSVYAAVK